MQEQMILDAIGGSEQACHELFDLWFPKAYRVAKAICGSRAAAEDAVQEALIRFWRAMPRLKDLETAEGYFLRTVANEAKRIARRAAGQAMPRALPQTVVTASAEDEADSRDRTQALIASVNRLPEKLRLAVQLHYFGGFAEAEVARLLDATVPSVKMRLSRARTRLRQLLVQSGYFTGG